MMSPFPPRPRPPFPLTQFISGPLSCVCAHVIATSRLQHGALCDESGCLTLAKFDLVIRNQVNDNTNLCLRLSSELLILPIFQTH